MIASLAEDIIEFSNFLTEIQLKSIYPFFEMQILEHGSYKEGGSFSTSYKIVENLSTKSKTKFLKN